METIRVAHFPDADDAFMHYAAVQGLVDTRGLRFEEVLADIETLNQAAREGRYEVTAISIHAYAYVADRYALLSSGASMGDGYGPVVIAQRPLTRFDLRGQPVATPGRWTSARLALNLWQPEAQSVDVPFDQVAAAVRGGRVVAGVLIHEGQLTYRDEGFHLVVDLGAWWQQETGLPLPLGGNAIRRDLPREVARRVAAVLWDSVRWGLEHRPQALAHALSFARGLSQERADRFVGMYVNRWTLDYGPQGQEAVRRFLEEGARAGLVPAVPALEFVYPEEA
ncbi:1,4-dihydroxy-6-naphtoate synthase [bacterium HR09]|nr:1,4-dihydroxy-6-naphtoate synthase [bacterium HR09]